MDWNNTKKQPLEFYQQIPKVELHRHLEGSLRLSTMVELARKYGFTLPKTAQLRPLVQVQKEEPYTFRNFLSKFDTLRLFYRSPEIIRRIAMEAIADAAADHIKYLELRFTPVALGRAQSFPLDEVMDWICDAAAEAQKENPIQVRLIASVNRHESPDLAEKVAELAIQRMGRGICGMDLAGNEVDFPAKPFANIFRNAKSNGLKLTIHAGEWAGPENIREAIEVLGADRIGHGVRVLENRHVVALAVDHGTAFEVCPTSNFQTGAIEELHAHPVAQMMAEGLNVTINTDDPSISQITLSDEYRLICEDLGLPLTVLLGRILAAAQATFLPEMERARLVASIRGQLANING